MRSTSKTIVLLSALILGVCFAGFLSKGFLLQSPPSGTWESAGALAQARSDATATLLPDGRMLVAGGESAGVAVASAELFGADGAFSPAASMLTPRSKHAAVALQDGRVLVLGGTGAGGDATAELYDPATNAWSSAGSMGAAVSGLTATLLQDGRVLIAGGDSGGTPSAAVEIYDPVSGNFSAAGALSSPRMNQAAALLADGRVLIVGGSDGTNVLASSDMYDPASGSVAAGPALAFARQGHTATTLDDGTVLIAGGSNADGDLNSAEIFDPSVGTFSLAPGAMAAPRTGHLAFLLPHNNAVLIVGGTSSGAPATTAELYFSWTGGFVPTGSPSAVRAGAAGSALSQDGALVVAGGNDGANDLNTSELYGFATVKTDAADYAPGSTVTITGSGWQPGETVTLTFLESPLIDTPATLQAIADENGNISNSQFSPDIYDLNVRFYLTASGSVSQAQTTFTDANRNWNLIFAGTGMGSVKITPNTGTVNAPVSCGGTGTAAASQTVTSTCSPNITDSDSAATVTLLATPSGVSVFGGWSAQSNLSSSTCTSTTSPCSALMGANASLTVTFNPGAAAEYVVTSSNYSPAAGAAVTITAQLADSDGNPVHTSGKTVTWSSTNGGSFAPGTSTTNANGVATVSFTTSTVAGTVHTVTATDNTSIAGTSPNITTQPGALDHIAFLQQPTNTVATQTITPAVKVAAYDINNNLMTTDNGTNINIAILFNAGSGTLSGTFPVKDVGGVSTFSDLSINNVGTGYTLQAKSGSVTSPASNAFNITSADSTPPTSTITLDPAAPNGNNGWYTTNVHVTVSATDNAGGSGVVSTRCVLDPSSPPLTFDDILSGCAYTGAGADVTSEGMHIVYAASIDNNGNKETPVSKSFQIDKTPPTGVTGAPNRSADHNGWYNHAVDVVFTGTDSLSGLDSCTTTTYSSPDGAAVTVNGSCTDKAGNTSTPVASSAFDYDATAPTGVSGAPNRPADHNGWYNHAVDIVFSGTDATSGIDTCTTTTYSGPDGTGLTENGTCMDKAGNTSGSVASSVFKYDATAPSVTLTPDRTPDHNGWYNHEVIFTVTGNDVTSDNVTCETAIHYTGPDSATASVTGHCTDDADNTGSKTETFKYDATAPTGVSVSADRAADSNGWYNHAFTATWTGDDATSGIDSCTSTNYSGPDTGSRSLPGSCTDNAGNTSSTVNFTFEYDATAPTVVSVSADRAADHNGWYNHAFTATWTGTDALSGIASCTKTTYSGPDTGSGSLPGSCTDNAGNTSSTVNFTFKYDATAPSITITVPPNGATYTLGQLVAGTYGCSDVTSGIDTCARPVATGANIDTTIGSKTFTVNAQDEAGNTASAHTNYSVIYGFAGLFDPYAPPSSGRSYKIKSAVPLKWQYTDVNGTPVPSANANPTVSIYYLGTCGGDLSGLDALAITASGSSGYQYDPTTLTWQFNWKTTGMQQGCYGITITSGQTSQVNPPPPVIGTPYFPLALTK